MASRIAATISGFNEFLNSQKVVPGKATFSLYQFDDQYEINYEFKSIQDVVELSEETYMPRGMTRLYDAIGKTIVSMGEQLSKLNEDDRPEKVFLVIQSDGQENDSREYKFDRITEMINHQKDVYQWTIIFLGCELGAVEDIKSRGVSLNNVCFYSNTDAGVKSAYQTLGCAMASSRSMPTELYDHTNFYKDDKTEDDPTVGAQKK